MFLIRRTLQADLMISDGTARSSFKHSSLAILRTFILKLLKYNRLYLSNFSSEKLYCLQYSKKDLLPLLLLHAEHETVKLVVLKVPRLLSGTMCSIVTVSGTRTI